MALSGNDQQKLESIAKKPYKEQAIWFLNAFWEDFAEKEAENLWKQVHKFQQLDPKGKEGFELDELNAHRFLEAFNETHTVRDLRDKLRSKGAINEKVKMFPLIHYLAIRFDVDWHRLVNAPQSGGKELAEATRRLEEAQVACQQAEQRASESRKAEQEAKSRESNAIKREAEAKEAEAVAKQRETESKAKAAEASAKEAELVAAKKELEAALAELKREEDAYNNKTTTLKKQSEEGSVVQRNRASNELAQHLSQETLPLRRAKTTQEAAVRKADKAAKIASEARALAEKAANEATAARTEAESSARQAAAARKEAEAAAREAERAAAAAAHALDEAQRKLQDAEEYLQSVKSAIGYGSMWWLDREIHEARAYLPQAKGGYKK